MHVVFVTAELEPLVSTGGLGAASAGLVRALRAQGVEVTVVVPDYWGDATPLRDSTVEPLAAPSWVGGATVRTGTVAGFGAVTLVGNPSIPRPHPYVDPASGKGWADNDHRFFSWSASVASLVHMLQPDVVHVNDWHAATVLGHLPATLSTVLSIHNLAHQGWGDGGWLALLGQHSWAYEFGGAVNALVGAIRLAHRVVAVSPTYAEEIRGHAEGQGLDVELTARGDALTGILNGIDTEVWNPATDPALPNTYSLDSMNGKAATRSAVRKEFGVSSDGPLFVVVSRFDYQKAVDVLLATTSVFETLPGSLVLLGNGDPGLEEAAASVAAINPRVTFIHGYLKDVAHRLFAAGDFAVVPSRFEPCGLTQMQAMRYGTIPIVTRVGGLADTVIDADRDPDNGTGIVAERAEVVALTDALHRAARLARNRAKFSAVRARGMAIDWSWSGPSEHYISLYKSIL